MIFPGIGGLVGRTQGVVSEVVIDQAEGSIIGLFDFVGGGNAPEKAFDDVTNQSAADSAVDDANSSWIGKDYSGGKAITRAVLHGTNNAGYSGVGHFAPKNVTLRLRGSNTLPTSRTDGTLLGSLATFLEDVDESAAREIVSTNQWTKWRYVWADVARSSGNDGQVYLAEVIFYENENA